MLKYLRYFVEQLKNRRNQQEKKYPDVFIHPDSILHYDIDIGSGTRINGPAFIQGGPQVPVRIGKYCAIGYGLRIRGMNHYTGYANIQNKFQDKYHFCSILTTKGGIIVGNNVWIGDNVVILSGVIVGDGAVLGAGSVVTKNIPPYSIAAGNPAKVIRKRFSDEIIEQLRTIKWWDWPEDKIRRNRKFFETDFARETALDIHSIIVN